MGLSSSIDENTPQHAIKSALKRPNSLSRLFKINNSSPSSKKIVVTPIIKVSRSSENKAPYFLPKKYSIQKEISLPTKQESSMREPIRLPSVQSYTDLDLETQFLTPDTTPSQMLQRRPKKLVSFNENVQVKLFQKLGQFNHRRTASDEATKEKVKMIESMVIPAKKSRFGGSERVIRISSKFDNNDNEDKVKVKQQEYSSNAQLPVIPSIKSSFKISKNQKKRGHRRNNSDFPSKSFHREKPEFGLSALAPYFVYGLLNELKTSEIDKYSTLLNLLFQELKVTSFDQNNVSYQQIPSPVITNHKNFDALLPTLVLDMDETLLFTKLEAKRTKKTSIRIKNPQNQKIYVRDTLKC